MQKSQQKKAWNLPLSSPEYTDRQRVVSLWKERGSPAPFSTTRPFSLWSSHTGFFLPFLALSQGLGTCRLHQKSVLDFPTGFHSYKESFLATLSKETPPFRLTFSSFPCSVSHSRHHSVVLSFMSCLRVCCLFPACRRKAPWEHKLVWLSHCYF